MRPLPNRAMELGSGTVDPLHCGDGDELAEVGVPLELNTTLLELHASVRTRPPWS